MSSLATDILNRKFLPKKPFRPENSDYAECVSFSLPRIKFNSSGAQVKPCRSGLRTGWVTDHEYRLKGPYVVLSFLLLLFCVLCGVIVNSVLKSRFSIISASGFRKRKKQRTNMAGGVRLKIIILRAVMRPCQGKFRQAT